MRPSIGRVVVGEVDTTKLNNFKQNLTISPAKIADLLQEQGIECARRTVAKYREAMRIPPASLRKSL